MRQDTHPGCAPPRRVAVIGGGRLGRTFAAALRAGGVDVVGPLDRGWRERTPRALDGCECVLLCVPDRAIASAAADAAGHVAIVGHTSGATELAALEPALAAGAAGFSLHPLMSFPEPLDDPQAARARLSGAGCAVAATSERALATARALAAVVGLEPFAIADDGRAAYHAAASIAANFLVTLEAAAERVAAAAGLAPADARRLLAPLVRRTVESWAAVGPERALTGPIARGDEATVARQRAAVAASAPELLDLFDVLAAHTRTLANAARPATIAP